MTAHTASVTAEFQPQLVATISAEQLLTALPARDLTEDEFVATLPQPGLGSPRVLVGRLDAGQPYDRIIMRYDSNGRGFERTWSRVNTSNTPARYLLESDTSSTGYVSSPN
ncbi:hypothetical protein ASE16_02340 [Leifsonia sp. Root227]|uniref:hypothetical protein n=1 Tax=Leifsonia sp. Root227 TaxID=1736496 RepID=UPI0006F8417E|nr:hypothetical protein [Leifsonia sp. Root227]KRC51927.1 hypothetical protein ASE16_02340 [Leifsonia sp. Root227]